MQRAEIAPGVVISPALPEVALQLAVPPHIATRPDRLVARDAKRLSQSLPQLSLPNHTLFSMPGDALCLESRLGPVTSVAFTYARKQHSRRLKLTRLQVCINGQECFVFKQGENDFEPVVESSQRKRKLPPQGDGTLLYHDKRQRSTVATLPLRLVCLSSGALLAAAQS